MDWNEAESRALLGAKIRRTGWADRWLEYDAPADWWWLQNYYPATLRLGTRVSLANTNFAEAEFLADDWTLTGIPTQTADLPLTWEQARLLALAGTRIRDVKWTDKWLVYNAPSGLWSIIPVSPFTLVESVSHLVAASEFTQEQFNGQWTVAALNTGSTVPGFSFDYPGSGSTPTTPAQTGPGTTAGDGSTAGDDACTCHLTANQCIYFARAPDAAIGPDGETMALCKPLRVTVPPWATRLTILATLQEGGWGHGPAYSDPLTGSGFATVSRLYTSPAYNSRYLPILRAPYGMIVGLWSQYGLAESSAYASAPDYAAPAFSVTPGRQLYVLPGAKELYLGFQDGHEWNNNHGAANLVFNWA